MDITPQTKVAELLEAHPALEDALVAAAPAFAKLRNPVLRATVARFATLAHAAQVSGVPLPELMRVVRGAVGAAEPGCAEAETVPEVGAEWPPWFRETAVLERLDAGVLLAGGEHPWVRVAKAMAEEAPGATIVVRSEFVPAPLLERAREKGWMAACVRRGEAFETAVRRP